MEERGWYKKVFRTEGRIFLKTGGKKALKTETCIVFLGGRRGRLRSIDRLRSGTEWGEDCLMRAMIAKRELENTRIAGGI